MYKEMSDDLFREFCKMWMRYLDPDFSPIPEPLPLLYKPLPHSIVLPYYALHPL